MNIGEANAWFAVVRALREPDLHTTPTEAVELLTSKANKVLGAGPRPDEVETVVADALFVLAEFSDDIGLGAAGPRVETADVKDGVL